MNKAEAINTINKLTGYRTPFFFMADFKCNTNLVIPLTDINPGEILYDIRGKKNFRYPETRLPKPELKARAVSFPEYKKAFDRVHREISAGNTYLLNLTFATRIETPHSLKDIFYQSKARYKLWYKNRFVVFSPERFVRVAKGQIAAFPMKGTIDADLFSAREQILANKKEMAEHLTIVDLIRNDMSICAANVQVERFRYIDKLKTNHKNLLQVSSKITGTINDRGGSRLGDIIYAMLPAGSICGAPKKKTLEIIDYVENYKRGFYTGVFGIYDGKSFDSGVMIRFIEKKNKQLLYKSGGGIHFLSNPKQEYQEMIDKIYVPVY